MPSFKLQIYRKLSYLTVPNYVQITQSIFIRTGGNSFRNFRLSQRYTLGNILFGSRKFVLMHQLIQICCRYSVLPLNYIKEGTVSCTLLITRQIWLFLRGVIQLSNVPVTSLHTWICSWKRIGSICVILVYLWIAEYQREKTNLTN